ncbi:MAG TPA: hypothetical protein VJZ25_01610, partial [Gemmatimonadaceae bacterium]|nr:hypothetical protein [Gemmatimonadaceae bacterium]
GRLGCPVCASSYPIHGGVADFRDASDLSRVDSGNSRPQSIPDPDDAFRFGAMLGLTRPGSLVVVEGAAATAASALSELTESRVIVLNPGAPIAETERVATVLAGERIPLAEASAGGIVTSKQDEARLRDAARILRPGGRIVAPAGTELGNQFIELARDERHVVAESIGQLVPLGR